MKCETKRRFPNKGPSARHQAPVRALVKQGWKTTEQRESIGKLLGEVPPDSLRPDAWRVVDKTLELVEVEVTHPITPEKAELLRVWSDWLGERGWTMRLWKCGRDGVLVEFDPRTLKMTDAEYDKVRAVMSAWPAAPTRAIPEDPTP